MFKKRFRGFLPVAVDIETGGLDERKDAILEIASVPIVESDGLLVLGETAHFHVAPFEGANIEERSLEITGIKPDHPFRMAVTEKEAIEAVFGEVRRVMRTYGCSRAIMVGHNVAFDLKFLNAAIGRSQIKRSPFHRFSNLDTVTLGTLAYGQTVLSRVVQAANIDWDDTQAHSALYDATVAGQVFCKVFNSYSTLA